MNDSVKSASRVLDMLELFTIDSGPMGVSDVAKRMEIPKSSAQALLQTLAARGYLLREEGRYLLPAELRGGWVGGIRARLLGVAAPAMQRMVEASGESAFVGMLTGSGKVQYLAKAVSPHDVRYDAALSHLRPVHCTSMGLVILAFLPEPEAARWLKPGLLKPVTPHTVTDPQAIGRMLEQARRDGYAEVRDAHVEGASGVSAPVFGPGGEVVAALNLGAPTWRYERERERLVDIVRREAVAVTEGLRAAVAAMA